MYGQALGFWREKNNPKDQCPCSVELALVYGDDGLHGGCVHFAFLCGQLWSVSVDRYKLDHFNPHACFLAVKFMALANLTKYSFEELCVTRFQNHM